jgi:hypothetical protein
MFKRILIFFCLMLLINCANDRPFMSGYIQRAIDALMTNCDPYNKGVLHTCVIYSSVSKKSLLVYDASVEELVLSPMRYFPLRVPMGPNTDALTSVLSKNDRFPYFLALDPTEKAIYVVRLFSDDSGAPSFSVQERIELSGTARPYKIAAYDSGAEVMVVLSFPEQKYIGLLSLHPQSGKRIKDLKLKPLGQKPSHVAIDFNHQKAIISDEGDNSVHTVKLEELNKRIVDDQALIHEDINIAGPSGRIFVERRDFGLGEHSYVAVLGFMKNELTLIDLDDNNKVVSLALKEHTSALYFPNQGSEPCCGGTKNWLAVMGIKGNLRHIVLEDKAGKLVMKEESGIDIKSEKNLSLSQLTVVKIVGGQVKIDTSLKRELECPNNRKMFFVSSFARDKSYWEYDDKELLSEYEAFEVEAQGVSCEGDGTATRLGDSYRSKDKRNQNRRSQDLLDEKERGAKIL